MDHLHGLDLSPANEAREFRILQKDVAKGFLPDDYYWKAVRWHWRNDITQTRNDARFKKDHPRVARIFDRFEREHEPCPSGHSSVPVCPPGPGPVPVPEPAAVLLMVTGLLAVYAWGRARGRG